MAVHKLVHQQYLNTNIDTVWKFFSGANNLQAITPDYMKFRVTSGDLPGEIYPGMIITYKVSPLLNIPLFWMTEIVHVVPGKCLWTSSVVALTDYGIINTILKKKMGAYK